VTLKLTWESNDVTAIINNEPTRSYELPVELAAAAAAACSSAVPQQGQVGACVGCGVVAYAGTQALVDYIDVFVAT